MTLDHSALLAQLDALKSADSGAVFAELIRSGLQQLIEAEATAAIGAGRYERSDGRTVHRNGHRPKTVSTTAGDIEVQIPKLRAGSCPGRGVNTEHGRRFRFTTCKSAKKESRPCLFEYQPSIASAPESMPYLPRIGSFRRSLKRLPGWALNC